MSFFIREYIIAPVYLAFNYVNNKCSRIYQAYNSLYSNQKLKYNNVVAFVLSLAILFSSVIKYFLHRAKLVFKRQTKDCVYNYKGRQYRIFIPNKKYYMPRIIEAQDLKNNNNIINNIREYAGPYENFHNESVTPKHLGYEKIRITTMNNAEVEVKEFNTDDVIQVN